MGVLGKCWAGVLQKSDLSVFLFVCCACVNSVTPSPPQVRVCPPRMLPEDGANLSSARGILSLIQSSTRRAYQQILDVLDENRRWLAITDSCQLFCIIFWLLISGLWCLPFVFAPLSPSQMQWFKELALLSFNLKLLSKIHISEDSVSFSSVEVWWEGWDTVNNYLYTENIDFFFPPRPCWAVLSTWFHFGYAEGYFGSSVGCWAELYSFLLVSLESFMILMWLD